MTTPSEALGGFGDVPVNQLFDWKLRSRSSQHAELALALKPEFAQGEGLIHGGIITALADTAAVYALLPDLPADTTMTSIELKVNFLRPVDPDGGELVARARVVQRGRRIAVCDVEVSQADKLTAKGLFTYLMYDRE